MSILSRKKILLRIIKGELKITNEENIEKFWKERFKINKDEEYLNKISEYHNELKKIKDELTKIDKYDTFFDFKQKYKKFFKNYYKFMEEYTNVREKIIRREIETLSKLNAAKKKNLPIFLSNFDFDNLQPANIDLRLGKETFTTSEEYPIKLGSSNHGNIIKIEPGAFGVFLTYETIYIPDDLFGLISLRSTYKNKGLVNVSGFHVDPGYYGKIMFAVYNTGPKEIYLKLKDPIFMIAFDELEEPALMGYEGKKSYKDIPAYVVTDLKGAPVSIKNLDERVKTLETQRNIYGALLITLLGAVILLFLRQGG